MNYGQEKWIIWPLGVKVRVGKGPFDEDDYDLQIDYAGTRHLRNRLEDMEYIDSQGNDVVPYELEALDPDWKSKLLDHKHDLYGPGEWRCESDEGSYNEALDIFLSKNYGKFCRKHNPDAYDKDGNLIRFWVGEGDERQLRDKLVNTPSEAKEKKWAEEWCSSHGRGKLIPLFMLEFRFDYEWIESHLKIKGDKRGKNPNSLKNLKQFRVDVEKVEA